MPAALPAARRDRGRRPPTRDRAARRWLDQRAEPGRIGFARVAVVRRQDIEKEVVGVVPRQQRVERWAVPMVNSKFAPPAALKRSHSAITREGWALGGCHARLVVIDALVQRLCSTPSSALKVSTALVERFGEQRADPRRRHAHAPFGQRPARWRGRAVDRCQTACRRSPTADNQKHQWLHR